ncbi:retrovirus-related pol polyprotein from transposon TNT 1-94, partial [Tanacetum coccineum]
MTFAGARETVGIQVVQQNGIQYFNCKGFGHYAKECRKPKRVKDYSYHKEKMMMCKQAKHGVPLQVEQADWLMDMDEEIDEQELEAHYSFMAKIQEVLPEESSSTEQPLEQRVALANLIANLTLNTEENKTILKQLKKANASLTQELEECKTNLDETSRALWEATSCQDSCVIALQNKQKELEKYIAFNDRTIDYDILQTKLNETLGLLARKDIDIKEEMHEDYEYVQSLEKEVDELESEKADFSNIYDLLLEEYVDVDNFKRCCTSYTFDVGYKVLRDFLLHRSSINNSARLSNKFGGFYFGFKFGISGLLHQVITTIADRIRDKDTSQSKQNLQSYSMTFIDKTLIIPSVLDSCFISSTVCEVKRNKLKTNEIKLELCQVSRQEYRRTQKTTSAIGSAETTPFSNSPEMRSFQMKQSVNKPNVSDGMYRIATTTTQMRTPQLPHASTNTNPHVSKSTGVNHYTSVSRPQLKSYQVKDKVVPNNSQVKFNHKVVEEHHRILSISRKTKSVTACNDSSKSRTLNVNAVCAECGKCVFNSNHDACVSRYLNNMNARTKKPKSVENADLKAQLQEKVFANAALKNELRKIKGNSVDTKFAKASILGKPPLQPSRNHLVVRQPNAFTSERPRISRPRFASQVDEKNDLSKTVTPHYLPKVRESAAATPHQVNAPNYSRNSHKESYGSNDMVHAYFLEDARKMTQDKTRIPSHKDMASTRAHCTPNACTPKPRNIYRSSPVSKCSGGMSNGEPLVDHSRNSSFFLDSKQLVCSICHKYIFNTNHDDCITKILNKVNSRAKVQSPKIRNNNPVEPKNHTHKPGRQNGIGQRFSLNKSSAVHEKPHTPRSCLRWKPTGRIFKTVRLRWIPTGKVFIDSTTKVDSEPPNGSNDDITNPYECNQTLYFSAGTSNSSAEFLKPRTGGSNEGTGNILGVPDESTVFSKASSEGTGSKPQFMAPDHSSSGPVLHEMTSDQIRLDLTPNQQETSIDNISLDLVSNKQKASDYDISDPVPPRK